MTSLTQEWTGAVLARAASERFADARQAFAAATDAYLAGLPPVPEQQAGYYHDFFCPQHAVQLVFDPANPHRHVCRQDAAVYSGEPFDSAWLWSVNDMLSDAAVKLAFWSLLHGHAAGRAQSKVKAARRQATSILTDYAARYTSLPRAPGVQPQYPGHAAWSVLDESVWIIRLAWAYMLLLSTLPANVQATVRDNLLRPAAGHILAARRHDVHNISNWNNAALAALGLALDDSTLSTEAVDGPAGLRVQFAQGVRPDGFWYENSLSYHYYALAALVWHVRTLRASGASFDDGGVLRRMLQAPIAVAFPDLTLPATHDCWYGIGLTGVVGHGIPDAAGFYEIGYGWYGDPLFAWILQQNYMRRPRSSFEALLDGALPIPRTETPVFTSHRAVDSGLAVVRSGAAPDRQTYLLLKAGPGVAGHGHPDQLSVMLFSHGERLSVDLGTPGYGIGLNETWYRHTASHNTVLVDGLSQPLANGHIDRFPSDGESLVEGSVAWEDGDYAGIRMQRIIVCQAGYFIDAFFVDAQAPRQIDWLYHNHGELVAAPPSSPVPEPLGEGGFAHVSAVSRVDGRGAARLAWHVGRARLDLYLSPPRKGALYLGQCPDNPASQTLSLLIRRERTAHATFAAVFVPWAVGDGPAVRRVRWRRGEQSSWLLTIETAQGVQRWLIQPPGTGETKGAVRLQSGQQGGEAQP